MRGQFGASDLAGRLTIPMPNERLQLDAALTTRQLDIIDAGPFIGYNPERLGPGALRRRSADRRPRRACCPMRRCAIEAIRTFDAACRL